MTTLFRHRGRGLLGLLALAAAFAVAPEARAQWTTSGANTTTTNNVGIGTTAPQTNLHISTAAAGNRGIINDQTSADSNSALLFFRKSRAGAAAQNGDNVGSIFASGFDGTNFVNSTRLRFVVDGPVSAGSVPIGIQFLTAANAEGVERMRITSGGNVGIGTTAPGSKFVVSANAANPLPFNLANPLGPQDGTILHIVNADNVKTRVTIDGFGTNAAPSISFRSGRGTLAAPAATLAGDALGIVYGGGFGNTIFHAAAKPGMWMVASENWTDTAAGSDIYFNTVQNGTATPVERMRLTASGNVGIGTNTPAAKLHVAGDIIVAGNINAKYQDVAEWVPSTQRLAAGTVVVLDGARDNHVLASKGAYDTRVAGVISAQPGLSLGEAGDGKVLVATTGRVRVRVDASRAPVRIGDLIVTSDVEGVAMKSVPVELGGVAIHRPGTLIGKALESLEKGTGEILVLLSLQ